MTENVEASLGVMWGGELITCQPEIQTMISYHSDPLKTNLQSSVLGLSGNGEQGLMDVTGRRTEAGSLGSLKGELIKNGDLTVCV